MAKLSVKIEAVTKDLAGQMLIAQGAFKKFGGSVKNIALGVAGFGTAIIGGIAKIGMMGSKLAQTQISMEAFLGSAEKAKQLISDLRAFSDVTPFKTSEILEAGKVLSSVEKDVTKILPTIKMLGDISAGTGKDLNQLTDIFVKMKNLGRVTFEELNQLANANIVSFDKLSETLGIKGKTQLRKYIEAGKLGFKDIQAILKESTAVGGRFNGLMEKQSKTLIGRWSTLSSLVENTFADMGGPLQNSLNSIVVTMTDWVTQMRTGRGILGFIAKDLKTVSTILESTRSGGSLEEATGLKGYGKADVAVDSMSGIYDILGGAYNPLTWAPQLGVKAMQGMGFGSESRSEELGLLKEVVENTAKTKDNTQSSRY